MASAAPRAEAGFCAAAGALLLGAAALASAAISGEAELAFAGAVIGTVGLAHGASDMAVVPAARRRRFVACYLLVAGATLALWRWSPTAALIAFLLLSAAHFITEEPRAVGGPERWCRGVLPVAGPALLHRDALAALFGALDVGPAAAIAGALAVLALAGVALLPLSLARAARRGAAAALAFGAAAAILLPPLAGFTVAFTVLHAWPQLSERVARTRSGTFPTYLRSHRVTLAGAAAVIAATAWLFADHLAPALATLFAGLAALATPHMLVTPSFARD